MYKTWPLEIEKQRQRPELYQLTEAGYQWDSPHEIITIFEEKVAKFAGSKYAVAVDSCSHGIFLSLKFLDATGTVTIPSHTYVSVPMQILHAGCNLTFEHINWSGVYQIKPYPIWDGAVRWQQDMYQGGFHVLSFQIKKRIPIGKGGMILLDDYEAYTWLKLASHDGRTPGLNYNNDNIRTVGWHYNMTPEDAARGILLMDQTPLYNDDTANQDSYVDLSIMPVFK